MKIKISEILVGERKRKARKTEEIAQSIKTIGLINPITIDNDYKLIAGLNRLEACKLLGYEFIECNVLSICGLKSRLAEIDENLIRDDLSVFENAQWLADRKRIYLELFPDTKAGGDRKSENIKIQNLDFDSQEKPESFIDSTARLTDKSRSVIAESIKIATDLKEFSNDIADLPIADKKTELLDLSRIAKKEPEKAAAIIHEIKQYPEVKSSEIIKKHVHVAQNSGENEWYTPARLIESARLVMASIDLDPASSAIANQTVKASAFYTKEDDGLSKAWSGNVWMNPPYAQPLMNQFAAKLIIELENINQAIVLVNNATETRWFQSLLEKCTAVCFPSSRVKFLDPTGKEGAPLQGQAIIYFGNNPDLFINEFSQYGASLYHVEL